MLNNHQPSGNSQGRLFTLYLLTALVGLGLTVVAVFLIGGALGQGFLFLPVTFIGMSFFSKPLVRRLQPDLLTWRKTVVLATYISLGVVVVIVVWFGFANIQASDNIRSGGGAAWDQLFQGVGKTFIFVSCIFLWGWLSFLVVLQALFSYRLGRRLVGPTPPRFVTTQSPPYDSTRK